MRLDAHRTGIEFPRIPVAAPKVGQIVWWWVLWLSSPKMQRRIGTRMLNIAHFPAC
jgi:hypothetical protein